MWQALKRTAERLLDRVNRSLQRPRRFPAAKRVSPPAAVEYGPLRRLLLTDGVAHTLFEEYAAHRGGAAHGEEETGWVLLGLREAEEAVVLATLPAGAEADAGVAHVRFSSDAQALASRIVRQNDRRLRPVGVVHTHPGSLRHPSDGDYQGDREWVACLRGGEGAFGIGTADASDAAPLFASQPRPNVQCLGGLRFSWYALARGEADYRPLPLELTIGPDLARPLHPLWPTLEAHAERINRLYEQLAEVRFQAVSDELGPGLMLTLPLAAGGEAVCVTVRQKEVRYRVVRDGEPLAVDVNDDYVDRGVYRLLAELAGREGG